MLSWDTSGQFGCLAGESNSQSVSLFVCLFVCFLFFLFCFFVFFFFAKVLFLKGFLA